MVEDTAVVLEVEDTAVAEVMEEVVVVTAEVAMAEVVVAMVEVREVSKIAFSVDYLLPAARNVLKRAESYDCLCVSDDSLLWREGGSLRCQRRHWQNPLTLTFTLKTYTCHMAV